MTTKTLYSVLAWAGVVVVGFSASPIAYLGGSPVDAAAAPPTRIEELRYVPADAAVVAYADVKSVLGSNLWRRLQELRPEGQQGRLRFRENTGIDLETDVDSVLAGMLPGDGTTVTVAVVKGRFDAGRIESFARGRGGVQETYQDTRLIVVRDGDRARAVTFLAPNLIAIGDSSAVRRAIDSGREGSSLTANPDMMKRIAEVEGETSAWAVGSLEVLAAPATLPDSVSNQISAVQWFSASGHVNGGLAGSLRAEARDDEAAADLRNVLGAFLATARQQVAAKPELQAMLDSFELGRAGKTVTLSFNLPSEFFESMAPPIDGQAGQ